MSRAMTRNQQIRKALTLLAPPPANRDECKHEVELALDRIKTGVELAQSFRLVISTKDKGGLGRYYASLARLQKACDRFHPLMKPWFSIGAGEKIDAGRDIGMAEALLGLPANKPSHEVELALETIKAGGDTAQCFKLARSTKDRSGVKRYYAGLRRLCAASNCLHPAIKPWLSFAISGKTLNLARELETAEALINQKSRRPARDASRQKIAVAAAQELLEWWGHKIAVTRSGTWARLVRILINDPHLDVFDHLRSQKSSPALRVQKLRGANWVAYFMRREPAEK
jgi:hypothetical protein